MGKVPSVNSKQRKKIRDAKAVAAAQVAAAVSAAAVPAPPPVPIAPPPRKTRTVTPAVTVQQPAHLKNGRLCDDELTLLADALSPKRRAFCDAILQGETGASAAIKAGYAAAAAKQTAFSLLRRDDVRGYIRGHQAEASRSTRVTLSTLIDRLWGMTCDPSVTPTRRDQAMQQLVRIFLAAQERQAVAAAVATAGLSEEMAAELEEKFLGVSA